MEGIEKKILIGLAINKKAYFKINRVLYVSTRQKIIQ
jgi:hypothetical protein